MGESLVVFKAITDSADQQFLFQRFLSEGGEVHIKDSEDTSYLLKALSINSQMHLKCHLPADFPWAEGQKITATFHFGGEKYLFESRPEIRDSYVTLPVRDLFHLQKRKNFRYTLPEDYKVDFILTNLNQRSCEHKCRLLDISTEGCAVEISQEQTELSLNDTLEAEIHIGSRGAIPVAGIIVNIRPRGSNHLVLGLQFNHVVRGSESRIIDAITELQRKVYQRRAS